MKACSDQRLKKGQRRMASDDVQYIMQAYIAYICTFIAFLVLVSSAFTLYSVTL